MSYRPRWKFLFRFLAHSTVSTIASTSLKRFTYVDDVVIVSFIWSCSLILYIRHLLLTNLDTVLLALFQVWYSSLLTNLDTELLALFQVWYSDSILRVLLTGAPYSCLILFWLFLPDIFINDITELNGIFFIGKVFILPPWLNPSLGVRGRARQIYMINLGICLGKKWRSCTLALICNLPNTLRI